MADPLSVVNATHAVRGRLPYRCHIAAHFDRASGVLDINSPELHSFSIHVDLSKLHEQCSTWVDPTHTAGVLDHDAGIEVRYVSMQVL